MTDGTRKTAATIAVLALASLPGWLAMALPSLVQARTYCSEPVRPFCVDRSAVFEDGTSQQRCRIEVEDYKEEIRAYLGCLDDLKQEVRQRAEAIEKRFACKAAGKEDCR